MNATISQEPRNQGFSAQQVGGLLPFGSSQQAVSPVPASIPSAEALRNAMKIALGFRIGNFEGERIAEALHEIGFAIMPLGATLHAEAFVLAGMHEFQVEIRVNAQFDARPVGAMHLVETRMLDNSGYVDGLSRHLANQALSIFERELAGRIAQAIEARRAETHSGSVADESAVAKPCAQGESA